MAMLTLYYPIPDIYRRAAMMQLDLSFLELSITVGPMITLLENTTQGNKDHR